jgi:hypothetical protein
MEDTIRDAVAEIVQRHIDDGGSQPLRISLIISRLVDYPDLKAYLDNPNNLKSGTKKFAGKGKYILALLEKDKRFRCDLSIGHETIQLLEKVIVKKLPERPPSPAKVFFTPLLPTTMSFKAIIEALVLIGTHQQWSPFSPFRSAISQTKNSCTLRRFDHKLHIKC